MTEQQQQAQNLFFSGTLTRKEIAAQIGITERTLYSWINGFSWQRLCDAAITAPAVIADKICSQIVELQNHIASREHGKRFPDIQEVEIIRKLVGCLDKLKKYPSKSQSLQAVSAFVSYIQNTDENLAVQVREKYNQYITRKPDTGFEPYSLEYDANFLAATPAGNSRQPEEQKDFMLDISGNNKENGNEPALSAVETPLRIVNIPVKETLNKTSTEQGEAGKRGENPAYPNLATRKIPAYINGTAPLTLEEFDKYSELVWKLHPVGNSFTSFRGRDVSSKWLQYNLFQWCLHPEERRFIYHENDYEKHINHLEIFDDINCYISVNGKRPPSQAA